MLIAYGQARIGRDVETRQTPDGTTVANVSLAFTYGRKGQDGKRQTSWIDASIWGKQAEALAPYLTKGTTVTVSVEDLHIETFTARDQTTGNKLVGRIIAIDLGARPADAAAATPPPARAPAPAPRPAAAPSCYDENIDSEIPF